MQTTVEVEEQLKRLELPHHVSLLLLHAAKRLDGSEPLGKKPGHYVEEAWQDFLNGRASIPAANPNAFFGALCSAIDRLIQRDRDVERSEKRRLFRRV
jgi:hypothetical protein